MSPIRTFFWVGLLSPYFFLSATPVHAQIVLSANDGHTLLQNGVQILPPHILPDTLSKIAREKDNLWHVTGSIPAAASVVGPPTALTISPDGHYAYLSSAAQPNRLEDKIIPNDQISVIDLQATPIRVIQTTRSQPGATTLRLSPDGQHMLVANGKSGSITWFRAVDGRLSHAQNVTLPVKGGFVGGVTIAPDGKRAFVSLWKGDLIYTINLNGDHLQVEPNPLPLSPGAWTLRITPDGHYMSVNVLGHGHGKPGSIVMLDLQTPNLKEVDRVMVPNAPEGTDISPDGQYLAVVSQNGSAMPDASPLYHARGIVTVFRLSNGHLTQLAQAPGPLWPQGLIFSPDGTQILTQGGVDHMLRTLSWNGTTLSVQGDTPLPGSGANLERQR